MAKEKSEVSWSLNDSYQSITVWDFREKVAFGRDIVQPWSKENYSEAFGDVKVQRSNFEMTVTLFFFCPVWEK